jgi:hypothetical protein
MSGSASAGTQGSGRVLGHNLEPVPSLGQLFARTPSSVLAKMANLDGSRSHGGRWDVLPGAMLREDPARLSARGAVPFG